MAHHQQGQVHWEQKKSHNNLPFKSFAASQMANEYCLPFNPFSQSAMCSMSSCPHHVLLADVPGTFIAELNLHVCFGSIYI